MAVDLFMPLTISLMFGISVVLFIWSFGRGPRAELSVAERLRKVQAGGVLPAQEVQGKPLFERVLIPLSEKIGRLLGSFTPGTLTESASKLIAQAGLSYYITGMQIAGFCWILAITLPTLFFVIYGSVPMQPSMKFLMIILAFMLGFRLPMIILANRAKKRQEEILKALPFSFDLLSISVDAGMGFDGAMAAVAERTRGPFAQEVNRTLTEVRLGKPRNQALIDLGERVGLDDLKSFSAAVAFVNNLGGSLSEVLKIQAESMRVKRRQRAEEKAMKAPVKMMIPLVFFIFPCMFVVILGPAAIMIAEDFINR
jgi:tight adherence protein C